MAKSETAEEKTIRIKDEKDISDAEYVAKLIVVRLREKGHKLKGFHHAGGRRIGDDKFRINIWESTDNEQLDHVVDLRISHSFCVWMWNGSDEILETVPEIKQVN